MYSGKGFTEVSQFLNALKTCVPTYTKLCKCFCAVNECIECEDKDVTVLNNFLRERMVGYT